MTCINKQKGSNDVHRIYTCLPYSSPLELLKKLHKLCLLMAIKNAKYLNKTV